ncbi:peptide ABC transporter permease [Hydrogenovibrio crunogenus]|uniref:Peptide ABC transporter permease n=1 Tax=Hydrogenovibrio crunogenus TaxID=39765 RepID=A0A4P7P1W8_9GAMM|nr:DUF3147 family protein [Hydrogenovibrio crunogenus]QBZ84131.1 peptide ABC transporter permease [Hydrogenovibrio crunogenus]
MPYYLLKISITVILIVVISEVAKRSSLIGGILASIPLVSVLAMTWLYIDTKDIQKVSELSISIVWLVIPSLTLFVTLPILLKKEINFYLSLMIAISMTAVVYFLMIWALGKLGIKL